MSLSSLIRLALAAGALAAGAAANAAATDDLREFVKSVHSGRSTFTQTVTSPNGKQRVTHGHFEFQRPSRFRFEYEKPYAQTIVGDGERVWLYDPDLNQVTSRKIGDALGATPAALLVSNSIEKSFKLDDQPPADGLDWVEATPRQADGTIRWLKVGFRNHTLAELEIADSFGQRSLMTFEGFQANIVLPAEDFRFTPPAGADVAQQ